jgi:hypothetical protein
MRRMLIALLSCLTMATLVLVSYSLTRPAESHATAPVLSTPTSANPYPACITEDGAGQALCMWDAQHSGNGMGISVVSGDCAYEDGYMVNVCVTLHSQDSYEVMNEDGSSNTVPNGADLVAECQDELQANKSEWNDSELLECFKAWM